VVDRGVAVSYGRIVVSIDITVRPFMWGDTVGPKALDDSVVASKGYSMRCLIKNGPPLHCSPGEIGCDWRGRWLSSMSVLCSVEPRVCADSQSKESLVGVERLRNGRESYGEEERV